MQLMKIDKKLIDRRTKVNSENISEVEVNFDEFQEVEKMTVVLTKDGSLQKFKDHLEDEKINE